MIENKVLKCAVAAAVLSVFAGGASAAPSGVAGSAPGGSSMWATDHYPGFEGLDKLPSPEKKDKGWLWYLFGSPKCESPAEQFAYAESLAADDDGKDAVKAFDAIVREWPVSPEAPRAQRRIAEIMVSALADYEAAFEEYSYLLDFYPGACDYAKIVESQYKLVNLLLDTRRMFLGMSFTGNRELRQGYEMVVRRAPGANYVPAAMLKIAYLREQDSDYEEAIKVYSTLRSRHLGTVEARRALYLEAAARMWLVRRLAYNLPRCNDTKQYLEMALRNDPSHPQAEEMRKWLKELSDYLAEDAWTRAKFYDSRQRTRRAAIASYEKFLAEYPDSPHADDARARVTELKESVKKGVSK
jgi:outer membrane protein assembly factor BamD (BamD/ComL family)